jgi:RNA polymerase sigma-70 factor (ECF subfamily)
MARESNAMDKRRSLATSQERASSTPPPSRDEGIALAKRAAAGDVRSTSLLLEAVAPAILRAVCAMMGRHHPDVDDAAQLALIGFIQALPRFRGECDPVHFAMRIAIRTAGATRRRSRSRQDHHDDQVDIEDIQGPADGPYAVLRRRAVLRLVDQLPEEQAETMLLRFVFGWKLQDIAQATGAPFNTVRSRLRLAKDALLRQIERDPALAEAVALDEE